MSDTRPILSLDDLFADSMQAQSRRPVLKAAKAAKTPVKTLERYTLPEFWIPARGVALIHAETQTLLGNFQEYTHKIEAHCRKLVRTEEPIVMHLIEYVHGDSWITEKPSIARPETWSSSRDLFLPDLILQQLGVHAQEAEVQAILAWGGIARIELLRHTVFHSPDGKTVLTLPAGTNVYECMSLDAKVALRKELQA